LILPNEPHPICDALSRAGIVANVCARADALSVMKDFAERGIGYVILPLSAVVRDVEAGRLTAVPIRQPSISQHVCLCYSSLRRLPPAAEHVLRFLEQETRAIVSEGQWPGGALCG
jgi:LysR family nitrogen assimilation transcriptional regulator